MSYSTVTIAQLVRWEGNPRPQADSSSRNELKASIVDKGVIMPLIVRPTDQDNVFEVIGGDTRRDIICELVSENVWESDREIPVIIREDLKGDDAAALDIAVSNNIHIPMHPMDQFYAYSQMVEMGRDITEIANAYGTSVRIVEQRLSYAKLDERARQMVKNDLRNLDWAAAMTMATIEEQKTMLDEIENDPRRYLTPHDVRRRLEDELVSTEYALFDIENLKDSLVRKDLFDPNGATYMKRSEFQPLQDQALNDLMAERRSEGWGNVSVVSERDFDLYKYNDGIAEKEIGEVIFVRHASGAIVEHAGLALRVEERLNKVSSEDEDAGEALFGDNEEESAIALEIAKNESTKDPTKNEGKKTQAYIAASKAVIIQAMMMEDPRLTIAATVAGLIMNAAPKPVEGKIHSDLSEIDPSNPARMIIERRMTAAREIMEEGAIDPSIEYSDMINRLLELNDAQLMTLLQVNVAKRVSTAMNRVDMMYETMIGQEGVLLQNYWRPDRVYLSTLPKQSLEVLANKILPARMALKLSGDKSDVVETLAQIFDDAYEEGNRFGENERQIVTSWAPLSLGGVEEESDIFNEAEQAEDEDGADIFSEAA